MFKIFKCKTKKEYDDTMDHLSAQAAAIYKAREEKVMGLLENDTQRIIFMDWWSGGNLWNYNEKTKKHDRARRYVHVSNHDWDFVGGYIMETASLGMG